MVKSISSMFSSPATPMQCGWRLLTKWIWFESSRNVGHIHSFQNQWATFYWYLTSLNRRRAFYLWLVFCGNLMWLLAIVRVSNAIHIVTCLPFSTVTSPPSTLHALSILTLVHLFNPLQALDNSKTQWLLQQFDKPYIYFDSDYCVPKIPLPDALTFVTQGILVVSKMTQARLLLWHMQHN